MTDRCTGCGASVTEGFRFCPSCGSPIVAASSRQERKVVSILFCDVVGFTAASEGADIEDVRARMAVYYRTVRPVLESFGGTVDKFIGDAVMAVFGVPTAREDDAERAVRAALAVVTAIDDLVATEPGIDLAVRIGINTGEVLVSLGETMQLGEGVVLGDVVNTAARIQAAAPVGGVAVGEETWAAVQRRVVCEPLPPVVAKGKSEPVPVWRAVAPIATKERSEVAFTPLVGRDAELAALQNLFDEVVSERCVRAVTVVGQAGIGKTRLVNEFRRRLGSAPTAVTWCAGQCESYGSFGFAALVDIVRDAASIAHDADSDAAESGLMAVLDGEADRAWIRSRLRPLLGDLSGSGEEAPPEQQELFTAWAKFFEIRAREAPIVIVVEDLHWSDPSLEGFLRHLIDGDARVPLLVVCTTRPDSGREPVGTPLVVGPLSDREVVELVDTVLGNRSAEQSVRDELVGRAGGNPLFVEELARSVSEGRDVSVPSSLNALIAARLDDLPDGHKQVVLAAAVIGSDFWPGALARLTGQGRTDVDAALGSLTAREMIRPALTSSIDGEDEYVFWHALVRDAAYQLLPRRARAEHHASAMAWLADRSDALADMNVDLLAHHSWEAYTLAGAVGDDVLAAEAKEPAARYATLAGERDLYLDVGAALTQLDRARQLTDVGHPQRGLRLQRWAEAATCNGHFAESVEALREAIPALEAAGDVVFLAQALASLDLGLWWLGDPDGDGTLTRRAIELLAEHPGPELFRLQTIDAEEFTRLGDPAAGLAAANAILDHATSLGMTAPPTALFAAGTARLHLGDPTGVGDCNTAIADLIAEGRIAFTNPMMFILAECVWMLEGPTAATRRFTEAEQFSRRHGNHDPSYRALALPALVQTGRLHEAVTRADELLSEVRAASGGLAEIKLLAARLHAVAALGAVSPHDLTMAVGLVDQARGTGEHLPIVEAVWGAAAAQVAAERLDEAAATLAAVFSPTMDDVRCISDYGIYLPGLARAAAVVRPAALEALCVGVREDPPCCAHAMVTVAAHVAERDGHSTKAAGLFEDAAHRWEQFQSPLEQAYAQAGQARCLTAVDDPRAVEVARSADELFTQMRDRTGPPVQTAQ